MLAQWPENHSSVGLTGPEGMKGVIVRFGFPQYLLMLDAYSKNDLCKGISCIAVVNFL